MSDSTELYPIIFDVVNSYTHHKVLQRRFSSILRKAFRGEASCPSQCAALIVKFLGEEITSQHQPIKEIFSTVAADRIIVAHAELFSDTAYEEKIHVSLPRLPSIVNEMGDVIFKENRNVGTVGAFLAFGATFAAYCEQKEGLGVVAVEKIVVSVSEYLDHHVGSWLKTKGGVVS